MYFVKAISTSFKLFSVETALCSFVNIPNFVTIFTLRFRFHHQSFDDFQQI